MSNFNITLNIQGKKHETIKPLAELSSRLASEIKNGNIEIHLEGVSYESVVTCMEFCDLYKSFTNAVQATILKEPETFMTSAKYTRYSNSVRKMLNDISKEELFGLMHTANTLDIQCLISVLAVVVFEISSQTENEIKALIS